MTDGPTSPRIEDISWGSIQIHGADGSFKDAKLYPGGAREWDWQETGTEHDPGIQPADIEELLEHGAKVVVLSRGMNRRLQVQEATLNRLEQAGVEAVVAETREAVRLYNTLRDEGQAVGGLFHSTC